MKTCDVIMPVYNNANVLPLTVSALFAQTIPAGWQCRLLLTDDESTDTSVTQIGSIPSQWTVITLQGPHTGSSGARNRALDKATADIVFFLGADIILLPDVLAYHLQFHEYHPHSLQAALGMVTWDPRLQISPLMDWMIHGGTQNDFDALLRTSLADPNHFFYGSHLSLKRSAIGTERFSEDFKGYGWEDLDFGRRLKKKGLTLSVLHEAIGLHHHRYTPTMIATRQYLMGAGLCLYQRKHPEEQFIPRASQMHRFVRYLYCVLGGPWITLQLVRISESLNSASPRLFSWFIRGYYWKGIKKCP